MATILPTQDSDLNALGERNRKAQADYLAKVNGTATTSGTTVIPPTNTIAPAPIENKTPMDTTKENVVGLNSQINTLFKKQDIATNTSSGLNIGGTKTTPTTPLSTPEDINKATTAVAQSQIANAQAEQEALRANTKAAVDQAQASASNLADAEAKYAAGKNAVNAQRIQDLNLYQAEYTAEMERQKNEAVNVLQPLQQKEREANQAELAKVAATNERSIYEAEKSAEANRILSNIQLSSMGLSQTPGAIATTARIANEGALKLAEVKTNAQYNYALVAKEMNKLETSHQIEINKIIAESNVNIIGKKKSVREDISKVQDNILLTDREKTERIEKIKNDYRKFRLDSESSMYSRIRESNKAIENGIQLVQTRLDKDKKDSEEEISKLLTTGQWDIIPSTKKMELSKRSGMAIEQISAMKSSVTYSAVDAGLKAILGKDFIASPETTNIVFQAAMSRVAMGEPLNVAVANAIKLNVARLPQVRESQDYQNKLRELNLLEKEADVSAKVAKSTADKTAAKNPWQAADEKLQNKPGYILQYNKSTGDARYVPAIVNRTPEEWASTKGQALLEQPVGSTRASRTQCGEWANDATGSNPGVQKIEERRKVFTSTEPLAGGQVFFEGSGYSSQYGHVAVVTNVNPDGTIDIKESNLDSDGRITERTISKDAGKYWNDTSLAKKLKAEGQTSVFSQPVADIASKVLKKYGVDVTEPGKDYTELSKILNSKGTEQDAVEYLTNSGIIPPSFDYETPEGVRSFIYSKWAQEPKNNAQLIQELNLAGITTDDNGDFYYEENKSKGVIRVMQKVFGSDKEIGTIKTK